jgi:hypothetical protein
LVRKGKHFKVKIKSKKSKYENDAMKSLSSTLKNKEKLVKQ